MHELIMGLIFISIAIIVILVVILIKYLNIDYIDCANQSNSFIYKHSNINDNYQGTYMSKSSRKRSRRRRKKEKLEKISKGLVTNNMFRKIGILTEIDDKENTDGKN
jgi:hypothetical protein